MTWTLEISQVFRKSHGVPRSRVQVEPSQVAATLPIVDTCHVRNVTHSTKSKNSSNGVLRLFKSKFLKITWTALGDIQCSMNYSRLLSIASSYMSEQSACSTKGTLTPLQPISIFVITILGLIICPHEYAFSEAEIKSHSFDSDLGHTYTYMREVFQLTNSLSTHLTQVNFVLSKSITKYVGLDTPTLFQSGWLCIMEM